MDPRIHSERWRDPPAAAANDDRPRLHARRADHGLAAVREATARGGLVFDSAPDPNNDLELLKQVSVTTRILGRAHGTLSTFSYFVSRPAWLYPKILVLSC